MAESEPGLLYYITEPRTIPGALSGKGCPSETSTQRLPKPWCVLVDVVPVSPGGGALLRKVLKC